MIEPDNTIAGGDSSTSSELLQIHGSNRVRAPRPQIFTPYFTTKSEGEGTGLGLYICNLIVTGHGGTMSIDDAPGGGAMFTVRLPAT